MRRRTTSQNDESPDHDSFLDIVANIVGILVILVVVVTASAKQLPSLSITADQEQLDAVAAARQEAKSKESEVYQLDNAIKHLDHELKARRAERDLMATWIAAKEDEIAEQRESLDGNQQVEFDLQNQLTTEQAQLERIRESLSAALEAPKNVVKLENYPTPIGKTVYGKEIHFRLLKNRVTYVPIDELVGELKAAGRARLWKLDNELTEVTETAGPIDGFRMRYTMEKVEIPVEKRIEMGRTGYVVQLKRFELVPTGGQLGETLEQAMQPASQFQQRIASLDRERTTVTLWVYPDSFAMFREMKKRLFEQGFATAARPLTHGILIGGSPKGSRSSAE